MSVLYQSHIPDLLWTGHVKGNLWVICWAQLAVIRLLMRLPTAALLWNTSFRGLGMEGSWLCGPWLI